MYAIRSYYEGKPINQTTYSSINRQGLGEERADVRCVVARVGQRIRLVAREAVVLALDPDDPADLRRAVLRGHREDRLVPGDQHAGVDADRTGALAPRRVGARVDRRDVA